MAVDTLTQTPTFGLELEKVFAETSGRPHAVGEEYFGTLSARKAARGEPSEVKRLGGTAVGVSTSFGEESLDNSFILGESATGPVSEAHGGLNALSGILAQEVRDVTEALAGEGATVINMANHPLAPRDPGTYSRLVVPKPIYPYLREVRGWNHAAGINANAQNSPSVGVNPEDAVGALNTIVGLGAGLIALYANSPFAEGRVTGAQESRLTMWDDMFGNAIPGDRQLHRQPDRPFSGLRDYFQWVFPPERTMLFATSEQGSEKVAQQMVMVDGNPSMLEFLRGSSWTGRDYNSGEVASVTPSMSHFAMHQFLQFSGARIRYGLNDEPFSVDEFNDAMRGGDAAVEALFAAKGAFFYIEGRDPGANFPDRELADLAGDDDVLRSVVISPAAIHAGLIRNRQAAGQLISEFGWNNLVGGLRDAAIRDGLHGSSDGHSLRDLSGRMLEVAAGGLRSDEQWMLAYPEFVLRSGRNGADRALRAVEQASGGTAAERIREITASRAIINP